MKKGLWLAASLLVVVALLTGGCSGQPSEPLLEPPPGPPATHLAEPLEGMKSLRWLTDDEKDKVIEIAFNSPKALYYKTRYSKYEVELKWIGITWRNSEPAGQITYAYAEMEKATELFQSSESVFPGVVIYFGEPPELQVRVAVDLGTETAIDVFYSPLLPPTPPRP